jgi:hypothetical protein
VKSICDDCTSTGQPTRDCWLCDETGCRHHMRKARMREGEGQWLEVVACLDPFACCLRHAKRIMR